MLAMLAMLDTSVAIHLRDKDHAILNKLDALDANLCFSIITRVELESGVHRDPARAQVRQRRLAELLSVVPTLPFNDRDAEAYGEIVLRIGYSRRKMLDRMIAAQALVHRATLVTLNPNDFAEVPGLSVLAW